MLVLGLVIIIINSLLIVGVCKVLIHRYNYLPGFNDWFWPCLALKCFAGIAVGLIYQYYYNGGDTINFHREAYQIYLQLSPYDPVPFFNFFFSNQGEAWVNNLHFASEPRALLFSKLLALTYFFTGANYWLSSIYLSLFCFSTYLIFVARLWKFLGRKNFYLLLVSFFVYPSVVFWSSGVLKESVAMGLLALGAWFFLKGIQEGKKAIFHMLWVAPAGFFFFQLKYYYAALFLALVLAVWAVYVVKSHIHPKALFWIWILLFSLLLFAGSWLHPNLQPDRFLVMVIENHDLILEKTRPENRVDFGSLQATWPSVIQALPKAIWTGLYQPFLWDLKSPFLVGIAAENILLFFLSLGQILALFRRKLRITWLGGALLIYCIFLGSFMALSSPNLGSLVRYKVAFSPFFLLLLSWENPWLNFLQRYLSRFFSDFKGKS